MREYSNFIVLHVAVQLSQHHLLKRLSFLHLFHCIEWNGFHLGCFYYLAVVNSAAMSTGVQISLQYPAFNSFDYIPRSGIAESYSSSIFTF
uniref:Uncharacterized protein n=1 Tax=Balaenoptera musculus TaxID=9771 RepID=A0A8C0CAR7_BALMU